MVVVGVRSRALAITALVTVLVGPADSAAQCVESRPPAERDRHALWWLGGALVAAASAMDPTIERATLRNRSAALDHFATTGNALGAGRNLVPTLAAGYITGRLVHQPRVADVALHSAVAYVAGDVVASIFKPALGRHRPDTTGSAWRFRPLASGGEWHSLPSAHTLHAFTLAGALSEEFHNSWLTAGSYSAASLVAWSRVYSDEHWASDVVLSAVLGAAIGHVTVRRLHAGHRSRLGELYVAPSGEGAAVILSW